MNNEQVVGDECAIRTLITTISMHTHMHNGIHIRVHNIQCTNTVNKRTLLNIADRNTFSRILHELTEIIRYHRVIHAPY